MGINNLACMIDGTELQNDDNGRVEPCPTCIKKATENGYLKGCEESEDKISDAEATAKIQEVEPKPDQEEKKGPFAPAGTGDGVTGDAT